MEKIVSSQPLRCEIDAMSLPPPRQSSPVVTASALWCIMGFLLGIRASVAAAWYPTLSPLCRRAHRRTTPRIFSSGAKLVCEHPTILFGQNSARGISHGRVRRRYNNATARTMGAPAGEDNDNASNGPSDVPETPAGSSLQSAPSSSSSPFSPPQSEGMPSLAPEDLVNRNNVNDQVLSAMSGCGGIKVTVATARNLVNEFMTIHDMREVPTDAMGRLAVCSLLMSNGIQREQTVQISMSGDGPLRGVVAISTGGGEVRGYVGNPALNGFDLEEAIGSGTVQVVKNHPTWPNPYNGITAIRNGDIDRDVGIYLAESEQRSCALAAATSVSGVLCKAAGGYLVEQLPDCDADAIRRVEENLAELVAKDGGDRLPTNLLLSGVTPVEIAQIILEGLDMKPLQTVTPGLQCNCSEERLFRSIRLLPREEVDEIIAKHEMIEARCHFCGRQYRMSPEEVETRFANAKGDPTKDSDVKL